MNVLAPFQAALALPASLMRGAGVPVDLLTGLRSLPQIADNTAAMAEAVAVLPGVEAKLEEVAAGVAVLPEVREAVMGIDARMATIESAMPALIQLQESLVDLPRTMTALEQGLSKMLTSIDGLMVSLGELNTSMVPLQATAERFGRIAGRFPGKPKP